MSWRHPLPPIGDVAERDHDAAIDTAGEYVGAPRLTNRLLDSLDAEPTTSEAFGHASLSLIDPAPAVSDAGRAIKDAHGTPGERDVLPELGSPRPLAYARQERHQGRGANSPAVVPSGRREQAQERAARDQLYGPATRSGSVEHQGARSTHLRVVHSDVPFGMTLSAWRKANKNATPPDATGDAA